LAEQIASIPDMSWKWTSLRFHQWPEEPARQFLVEVFLGQQAAVVWWGMNGDI
jgi:hypothetical protein